MVDENGDVKKGRPAFVDIWEAKTAGRGAFPHKVFHRGDVLVDGMLGAVEYVWQGVQTGAYEGVELASPPKQVRMRGMLFLEFSEEGLVRKVVSIYDEGVVGAQLTGKGGYLYP